MIESRAMYIRMHLLELNEIFRIPVFQRNYSWTTNQCKQLLEDIFKTRFNDYKHFIGNIISQRFFNIKDYINENIIIDGQQRITTIFLFIKALIDISENENDLELLRSFIFLKDGKKKIKLNINDDIEFDNLLKNDFNLIHKNSEIYTNYLFFKRELENSINNENISVREIIVMLSNLVFVQIFLDSEDNAQIIFERINSTGLELSTADLIRNFLLMSDLDQEFLYKEYWKKIEDILGYKNLDAFIHHYLIYKTSKAIPSNKVYEAFKEEFFENKWDRKKILIEMLEICLIYSVIIQNKRDENKKINKVMNDLIIINQKTCYPFLISLFEDYNKKFIDENTFVNSISLIRNYLLRRTIVDKTAKNLNKFFSGLYSKIFKERTNKQNYFDSIASYFIQITTTDRFPSDYEFKLAFQRNNMYSSKTLCKFILLEIENYNSKEYIDPIDLSIEHIMPQSKTEEWANEIGRDNYEFVMEQYLHNIGNLTLTGYNPDLSNNAFIKKKEKLLEKNLKTTFLNMEFLENENWTETHIVNRCNRLVDVLTKIFEYAKPENKLIYKELNSPKKTLEDFGELNGTKISKFIINGETFFTKDYTEMLKITLKELYKGNLQKIRDLANQNYSFRDNSTIDLSFYEERINRKKIIPDTDIYYNYNYSPTDVVCFIEKIYDDLNLDKETFEFYVAKKEVNFYE